MQSINIGRWLIGGVIAGVLVFLAEGFIHAKLLHEHWMATMRAAGRSMEAEGPGSGLVYFAASSVLRGLALAWVYAVIRSHFGPGPKTAIIAGLAVWAIMFAVPFIAQVPIGFHSGAMLGTWALYELILTVVAGLVAGAVYKDAAAA